MIFNSMFFFTTVFSGLSLLASPPSTDDLTRPQGQSPVVARPSVDKPVVDRTWADKSGVYKITAELLAFDDETVILKKSDGEIVAFPVKDLSEKDREFLETQDALAIAHAQINQKWTLRNGVTFVGQAVAHVDKEVVLQFRRGRLYVNDRVFSNLPEVYQKILPAVVSHFEKLQLTNSAELERWMRSQGARPRKYQCEGVAFAMENGDEYAIPFFLLSDADQRVLAAGREEFESEKLSEEERQRQALYLRALASEYQRDRVIDRQIRLLQLDLLAVNAGLVDVWEVAMIPPNGAFWQSQIVVVTARNSLQAAQLASQRWPGYTVGPIRRVNRFR